MCFACGKNTLFGATTHLSSPSFHGSFNQWCGKQKSLPRLPSSILFISVTRDRHTRSRVVGGQSMKAFFTLLTTAARFPPSLVHLDLFYKEMKNHKSKMLRSGYWASCCCNLILDPSAWSSRSLSFCVQTFYAFYMAPSSWITVDVLAWYMVRSDDQKHF